MRWLLATLVLLATPMAADSTDPRSHELVRQDCVTGNLRADLTLFGNGTFRVREGVVGEERMHLSELDPDSRDAFIRRLQKESLGGQERALGSLEGNWTETCRLALDIPSGPRGEIEYGRFDSLTLEVGRVVAIVQELHVLARASRQSSMLDRGYSPTSGDVLIHRNGGRYRVAGLTSDRRGVELVGIDQPLTLYVAVADLAEEFVGLEREAP